MGQISLAAELYFLDSPHRLIFDDDLVPAGPEGKQTHQRFNDDVQDGTGMLELRTLEHLYY